MRSLGPVLFLGLFVLLCGHRVSGVKKSLSSNTRSSISSGIGSLRNSEKFSSSSASRSTQNGRKIQNIARASSGSFPSISGSSGISSNSGRYVSSGMGSTKISPGTGRSYSPGTQSPGISSLSSQKRSRSLSQRSSFSTSSSGPIQHGRKRHTSYQASSPSTSRTIGNSITSPNFGDQMIPSASSGPLKSLPTVTQGRSSTSSDKIRVSDFVHQRGPSTSSGSLTPLPSLNQRSSSTSSNQVKLPNFADQRRSSKSSTSSNQAKLPNFADQRRPSKSSISSNQAKLPNFADQRRPSKFSTSSNQAKLPNFADQRRPPKSATSSNQVKMPNFADQRRPSKSSSSSAVLAGPSNFADQRGPSTLSGPLTPLPSLNQRSSSISSNQVGISNFRDQRKPSTSSGPSPPPQRNSPISSGPFGSTPPQRGDPRKCRSPSSDCDVPRQVASMPQSIQAKLNERHQLTASKSHRRNHYVDSLDNTAAIQNHPRQTNSFMGLDTLNNVILNPDNRIYAGTTTQGRFAGAKNYISKVPVQVKIKDGHGQIIDDKGYASYSTHETNTGTINHYNGLIQNRQMKGLLSSLGNSGHAASSKEDTDQALGSFDYKSRRQAGQNWNDLRKQRNDANQRRGG